MKYLIAYDAELKRPGCPLIQAAMGGDPRVAKMFPVESWLIALTPGLKLREVDDDQLSTLVDMAIAPRLN